MIELPDGAWRILAMRDGCQFAPASREAMDNGADVTSKSFKSVE